MVLLLKDALFIRFSMPSINLLIIYNFRRFRKDNFTFKCHRSNTATSSNVQDIYAVRNNPCLVMVSKQVLKYRPYNRLTKCPKTLRSDIWIVVTLSSVWLGNKCECRQKLILAQFGKVIWILAMNFRTPQLITHFQFTSYTLLWFSI